MQNNRIEPHKQPQARHCAELPRLRLPPFAKQLKPRADRSLIVVVGRRGWDLFDHPGRGQIGCAILMPNPDPSLYRWPDLAGWADCLLIDADRALTADEEREIARALLVVGCPYIVGRFSSYRGGRTA